MKLVSLLALFLATSAGFTATATAADTASWSTDYAAALEQAKAENKRVFLFFTGSDWCGWCKKLQAEVLTKPEFAAYAAEQLVLVELDFPQRKKQSSAIKAQNEKLLEQFKIEGFPTVIVLDGSGKKVGELGYQAGGPAAYVDSLKAL